MLLNKINTVPCLKSAYTCKIGKVFKKRRKLLSLTEFEVASQLYINVNYIKGIEQGDYSVFPARVFAKQYFRKYANYLNLKISFFDADHEIIDKTGVSIDHIFDVEGEEGFRKRESDVLEDLCSKPNIVLATGGGAVLSKENRELIKKTGTVIYLLSSVEQILRRTAKSKTRPLLENSTNRRKTISDIIDSRDPLYREVASVIINTNGKKLIEIINEIKIQLSN